MEPFIGQIQPFGFNFAPRGWAKCDGQLIAISSNNALFSLLGTTYGGDGRTTFALPDLRGRVSIHHGSGPGLSSYRLGQKGGTERVTAKRGAGRITRAGNQGADNRQPYLALNWCIALVGVFPSRN